jgi:hypothetical protein
MVGQDYGFQSRLTSDVSRRWFHYDLFFLAPMDMPKIPCMRRYPGILAVVLVSLAASSELRSQNLLEYPQPIELEFPQGYDIYNAAGKLLKTVPGPTRAMIQAYFEQDGQRLYLSDWSYERYKNQGIKPNIMLAREAVRPVLENGRAQSSPQNASGSVVEGFNDSGGRWAYEFIVHSTEPTLNLTTDSTGVIAFADSEFVVRAVRLPGSWEDGGSNEKTELSFYDTKTCRLVSIVSVPNRVFAVGKLGTLTKDRFYIGTITPAKYRYDDCPLAITLAELSSQSIERIPLVTEDYWFALDHGLEIDAKSEPGSESIRLIVERNTSSQYEEVQPQREAFLKTRILITEGSKVAKEGERWADLISEEQIHRKLAAKEEPGLGYLGVRPHRSENALSSDKLAFTSTE